MNIPGVDKLIGRLENVLENEAELIWRVPSEVKDFKGELENMQAFLEDADQGEMQARVEGKWVADIRDKAYEAEDIIDEFTYHMTKHQYHITCFSRFLHTFIDTPKTLWVMHQTAHKLQKMKKSITDIAESHTRYKTGESTKLGVGYTKRHEELVQNLRGRACFIEEKSIIGFYQETETVKQWLQMDTEPLRAAISVFGMGGAGKTTLVSKIYKDQRGGFDLSAWITISQTYTVNEILRSLIGKFDNAYSGEKKSHTELVEKFRCCLSGRRYLIVLDDVWDTVLWMQMEAALPENRDGSRILVTTRDERNAPPPSDVKSYTIRIGELQSSESWDLFSMKAFANHPNKICPPHLYSWAQRLVHKCGGLPLALLTLGGHMSSKMQEHEWTDIYDKLYKIPDLNVMKSILMLSFSCLPYSLKHCFLYCCLYPEDRLIKRERLIRQWIAEGFVEGADGNTPEEVADSCLSELVFRSMLLVEERNVSGKPKVIKMHDVMRDFAFEIAKREKFCGVYNGREEVNGFEAYRWSIHYSDLEELKLPASNMARVRSLSMFGFAPSWRKDLLKFKMLRLLDLEDNEAVSELPHVVGNLFNLRYLNLRSNEIGKLPGSIGRLLNLQTLDISGTWIKEVPKGVGKLRNLRHLILQGGNREGIRIPFNICKLNKLQVLVGVRLAGDTLRQLGSLTQLIRLEILSVAHDGGDLNERRENWKALGKLKLLQRFRLCSKEKRDLPIENLMLPLKLTNLYLHLSMEFPSNWFSSRSHIAALPNLVSLQLSHTLVEELHFGRGFSKLKQLSLCDLPNLKKVIFEEGTMAHMESLAIRFCPYLQALPDGIEHLTNLRKLVLYVPYTFKDSFEEGIRDWTSKGKHMPAIHLSLMNSRRDREFIKPESESESEFIEW